MIANGFALAPSQRFAAKLSRSTSIPPGEPFPQECFDITRVSPLSSQLRDGRLLDSWLLDGPPSNDWLPNDWLPNDWLPNDWLPNDWLLNDWLLNNWLPNDMLPNNWLPANRALLALAPALASTEQAAWAEVMSLEVVSPDIVG